VLSANSSDGSGVHNGQTAPNDGRFDVNGSTVGFNVDDFVEVRGSDGSWVQGRIAADWEDGTWNVLTWNAERMCSVAAENIRLVPTKLVEGARVMAVKGVMWGKSTFVDGTVARCRPMDQYDVTFDDGETEEMMHRTLIKLVHQ
jgi:hypothetical protein